MPSSEISQDSYQEEDNENEVAEISPIIQRAIDEVNEKYPNGLDIKSMTHKVVNQLYYYFSINDDMTADLNFATGVSDKATSIHEKLGGHRDSALRQALHHIKNS